jgi:hypothetical protein
MLVVHVCRCRHVNAIHVAAILTRLANISKAAQQPSLQPQHGATAALVHELCKQLKASRCRGHSARGLANILWALGKMPCVPDAVLVHMLLRSFMVQLPGAVPQDVANVLWGAAQLTRDHGLRPSREARAEAERLLSLDDDSDSNAAAAASVKADLGGDDPAAGGDAAAAGRDCAATNADANANADCELLPIADVQRLLQQLCQLAGHAAPQTISNTACALCVLQHCHRWCLCCCLAEVRQLFAAFAGAISDALPSHVLKVVKCSTQLALVCSDHAGGAWLEWQPPLLCSMLAHLAQQRKTLKPFHVASVLRDVTQLGCLMLPMEDLLKAAPSAAAAAGDVASTAASAVTTCTSPLNRPQQHTLLAMAAAASAAAVIIDVRALEDGEDDSGLPRLVADESIFAVKHAGSSTGGEAAVSSSSSSSKPSSPQSVLVHSIVSEMFGRLTLSADSDEQASAAPGACADARQAVHNSSSSSSSTRDGAAAQSGSPEAGTVLPLLLPLLEQLGLLRIYCTLWRMCISGEGLGWQAHNTSAAVYGAQLPAPSLAQQQQLQHWWQQQGSQTLLLQQQQHPPASAALPARSASSTYVFGNDTGRAGFVQQQQQQLSGVVCDTSSLQLLDTLTSPFHHGPGGLAAAVSVQPSMYSPAGNSSGGAPPQLPSSSAYTSENPSFPSRAGSGMFSSTMSGTVSLDTQAAASVDPLRSAPGSVGVCVCPTPYHALFRAVLRSCAHMPSKCCRCMT